MNKTATEWFDAIALPKTISTLDFYVNTLLHEEVNELTDSRDIIGLLDAVGDIDFVVRGVHYILKDVDADEAQKCVEANGCLYTAGVIVTDFEDNHPLEFVLLKQAITTSNFTKLCKTRTETQDTQARYLEEGIKTYISKHNDLTIVRVSEDTTVGGKLFKKDKVMKSVNFEEPKLQVIANMLEES